MAYGLELYDGSGNQTLSIQDRVGFFIARLTGTVGAGATVNISVANINSTSTKAIVITSDTPSLIPLQVTVGTNVVSIINGAFVSQPYFVLLVRVV